MNPSSPDKSFVRRENADNMYGYEHHTPTTPCRKVERERHEMMPRLPQRSSDIGFASEEFSGTNCPPMSPDRVARKQRSISRRGGACYATLLQSAVQASMSSFDPTGSDGETDALGTSFVSLGSMFLQDGPASPRKRVRRLQDKKDNEDAIEYASDLLGSLCVGPVDDASEETKASSSIGERKPPVRRVSRRTSYDSRVSDGTDFEFDGS
ncbi:predicted protein [Phaeodactylum tricornutum CCAP 1055/1]|uniref:Uncharacterized protein n=1 Tax=Phaeodactylum tricornutum (strain CCAP 1055/1) TaxID=556484 RepID=B7G8Y5_PHATC|nr:predicted protein [Phaeodactylum tricornutum CCAP 1055/1]EEC44730.1 predicted protein [Phaeodactylum tricornutum CCAP 1055/1]|eukprot:XP_002183548.1 predicted protein [Phaeodactylum tricornutum CCAP 1055/1]